MIVDLPPAKRRKTEQPVDLSEEAHGGPQECEGIQDQPSTSNQVNVERPAGLRDICSFFSDRCQLGVSVVKPRAAEIQTDDKLKGKIF